MFENYFVKCTKALTAIPLFHGECDNLQMHNSDCSYSLSIANFLEEQF